MVGPYHRVFSASNCFNRASASSNCSSLKMCTPASCSLAVLTPGKGTFFPVKVPSYEKLLPHDGLFSLNTAIRMCLDLISSMAASAPCLNGTDTSLPSASITLATPRKTAIPPAAPSISAGALGIGRPPATSGHTATTRPSCTQRCKIRCSQRLSLPL